MKITKSRLKEIIKEEVEKIIEGKIPYKRDADVSDVKVVEEEDLDELMNSGPMPPADDGRPLRPKKKDEDK